jgi:pimeloyl-ACP methyl ester carboxylesterase
MRSGTERPRPGAGGAGSAAPVSVAFLQAAWQPRLELLALPATCAASRPPILMVHGAYTHGWSWSDTFMPYFAALGHDVFAVSLRGHGASDGTAMLDAWGLDHYGADVGRALAAVGRPVIAFGSSMGGLVLQRLLAAGARPLATVLLSSVPPSGLMESASRMAFDRPHSLGELVQLGLGGHAHPRFVELLAADPLPPGPTAPRRLLARESARAIWEMTWAPLAGRLPVGGNLPMLAVHGALDRMIPVTALREIARSWNADTMVAPGIGHVPMIERRWREVADAVARWIEPIG